VCNNLNLAARLLADDNVIAEVSSSAVNLDSVVQELLKGGKVEDLVIDGLGAVQDELLGGFFGPSWRRLFSEEILSAHIFTSIIASCGREEQFG